MSRNWKKRTLLLLPFLPVLIVYWLAMHIPVMEVDAAQYAEIARQMLLSGNYLEITYNELEYLDKPPLVFWTAAASYSIFGVTTWAYKLPSFLFALLAIFSTYRFAQLFYTKKTAYLSALIIATCQALFLIIIDPRTDTLLLGAMIFSFWQISKFLKSNRIIFLILGSAGIGLAMLAKGPLGIMLPALGFGIHFLMKREWKQFFRWEWLPMLLIIALMLLPMSIGLYRQFDMNPDKVLYGQKGLSGLKFYFWDQSFGRLTGDNPFINRGLDPQGQDPFYFLHTILWSFMPWSLAFAVAVVYYLRSWFRDKWKFPAPEYLTWSTILIALTGFSLSGYKLPHYIYVVFPFMAIQTARLWDTIHWSSLTGKIVKGSQYFSIIIIWAILGILAFWLFPVSSIWIWLIIAVFLIAALGMLFIKPTGIRIFVSSLLAILAFNFLLTAHTYPRLLEYQSTSEAGKLVLRHQIPTDRLYFFKVYGHALPFYAHSRIPTLSLQEIINKPPGENWYIFTDQEGLNLLDEGEIEWRIMQSFPHYNITLLTGKFLNPETREETIQKRMLIKVPPS